MPRRSNDLNVPQWKEGRNMQRILVVDDDPSIQLLYEQELSEAGYDAISSDGAKGLLELIIAKTPDLILFFTGQKTSEFTSYGYTA
jgi:PleD family two-component response regulator